MIFNGLFSCCKLTKGQYEDYCFCWPQYFILIISNVLPTMSAIIISPTVCIFSCYKSPTTVLGMHYLTHGISSLSHSVHCPPGSNLASAGCWRGDVRDVTWVTQDSKGKWSIEHSDIVSLTVNRKFKMRCKSMRHQWGTKSSCSLWIHSHQPTRLSSTKWRAQQPCGRRSTPTQNSTSKILYVIV